MSGERRFAGRVRRLSIVSGVALGVIWALWTQTVQSPASIGWLLVAGWILMPALLVVSLRQPAARYAVGLPSSLVIVPLLSVCVFWLPSGWAGMGWITLTGGILLGGGLGAWFWYPGIPVPQTLSDPFSRGRLLLISTHVGITILGTVVVAATALS